MTWFPTMEHNEANQEENRDGSDNNRSWNCGVEGPSNDTAIEKMRNRQIKNMLAIVLLSAGTPMIMMGDEVRRTQLGNNNAYCQDNALSWLDWSFLAKHADLLRFVNRLVRFRANFERSRETETFSLADLLRQRQIQWHGVKPLQPDWGENAHSLAFTRMGFQGCEQHLILLNAYWEALQFELPSPLPGSAGWLRFVDTSLDCPFDVNVPMRAPLIESACYTVRPRSAAVLICRKPSGASRWHRAIISVFDEMRAREFCFSRRRRCMGHRGLIAMALCLLAGGAPFARGRHTRI